MHSVASHWKGFGFIESIQHVFHSIAMELYYVYMMKSQRYEEQMSYIAAD